jgi:hypothetical protein
METLKQLYILHSVDLRSILLKSRVDMSKLIQRLRPGSGAVQTRLDH